MIEISGVGFILHLRLEDFQYFLGKGTNCKISYAYILSVSKQLVKIMVYGVTLTQVPITTIICYFIVCTIH